MTKKQIKKEIAALKKIKPRVPRTNFFRDDHHAAIDAQIKVLSESMSIDRVFDEFPSTEMSGGRVPEEDCVAQNVHEAAYEAARWLNDDEEIAAPSEGWEELCG